MSSDVAATILFGDLRYSYEKQLTRVERLRAISSSLEAQFLASVRERATRPNSSVSDEEKKDHEGLRRLLNRARLQLSDEVRLLQWLRRRHNMAIIEMEARVHCAERTLSLLASTYLANAEAVKANVGTVVDTVLSQNLFGYISATGIKAETAKRYDMAVQKWIARINSLATGKTPDMRVAGILLMKQTALQAPAILVDNIAKWTTTVVGLLSKSDMASVTTAALQTVLVFMDVVREVPVMRREIASAQVPRINQAVLALAETSTELAESAIETLMYSAYWFPTLFRPLATKTESLCLRILGDPATKVKTETYKRAAECVAALCAVGGKVAVEDQWFQVVQTTLGTIRRCIEHILCVEDSARESGSNQAFDLPELDGDFIVGMPQAADRIGRMTDLLVALFTRPVNVDVPAPVDGVVRVASRLALAPMLAENSKTPRAEHGIVPMLAPQLYREAIRMLAVLVFSMGCNMYPFLGNVARTIGTINTTSVSSPTTTVALYSLIRLCVERYGYGFVVCLPRDVLSSIIDDTQAQSSRAVKVAADSASGLSTPKKRGSGRSQRQAAQMADEQLSRGHLHVQYTDVVHAALNAVLAILEHTPSVLGTELRTQLDSRVLTLLLLEMVGGTDQPHASRQSDAPYRALLCKCLRASVLSPDPWQKAIVPHALAVFTAGLEDSSGEVRVVCADALLAIDPIVHARLPAQLRAPDTDEGMEAESQVPRLVLGTEAGLSAALAEAHLDSPLTARADNKVSAFEKEEEVDNANKRHKSGSYQAAASAEQDAKSVYQEPAPLQDDSSDSNSNSNMRTSFSEDWIKSQDNKDRGTIRQPTYAEPSGTPANPAKPAVSPSQSSSSFAQASSVPEASSAAAKQEAPADGNNGDGDDDIPDIVMEGSDSEDDDV
ncbi:hypothetical protein LPJ74_000877 [Coemansia sp. RSA 1843]|nr:hypothetical protein LPJ74_000877 [Coemansia sp. RSA 1843]